MNSRAGTPIAIVTVFWGYVAVAGLLSANSLQAALTAMHQAQFFAPWGPQVLRYALLYPVLLSCVWASRRIGWRPLMRRLALQVLVALAFAVLAIPCLALGEILAGDFATAPRVVVSSFAQAVSLAAPVWLSSILKFLLTYAFAIALVSAFELYRMVRDHEAHSATLQRELVSARLASLRTQLSPHSLFNLLHTLHGQIQWDPPAAQALVVRLGELLRRLLNASEREYWRLGEELQFARLYLELQQQRFVDRLKVSASEGDGLAAVWVPSLILQPLVENAVVHGLAGHHGPVSVRLEVTSCAGELTLRVVNTTADEIAPRVDGIGLRNVRDRLVIHFGERGTVRAEPGRVREWVAEIRLPLLLEVGESAIH